ncbi:hypothetical protein J4G48_0040620 [Bradyrhizobium barranii subsp. apii]|uniref:hypothetical protein n=1 Tax=Bradyrhizobium barranii TaxID=2992140 RepID=UPI001AA1BA8E|nr:hypothetical protein [Bradyrhizobium barranii]UPT95461.1 hypothetical protein J4G48_0040620 [Bradyrhizobium barranii subsp. apii]
MRHPGLLTPPQNDLGDAIRLAYDYAPCGICYLQGQGWSVYDLRLGCGDAEPEYVYIKPGMLPMPLTDHAFSVLESLVKSRLGSKW